ncbi:MAG: UPF0262 family protein [Alphaproteobacteria bacterium]|nr:UPF0262 family protein [Alphaproteobacteria bacterium]
MKALNLKDYIHKIELDERHFVRRSKLVEAERAAAIRDLVESNTFRVKGCDRGPYYVRVSLESHCLVLRVRDCLREELPDISLSLSAFRKLIKDYFLICESYQIAYASGDKGRLETVDMARRGLHDEGARLLRDRLESSADMDHETARCIFTLICVLHIGAVQPW